MVKEAIRFTYLSYLKVIIVPRLKLALCSPTKHISNWHDCLYYYWKYRERSSILEIFSLIASVQLSRRERLAGHTLNNVFTYFYKELNSDSTYSREGAECVWVSLLYLLCTNWHNIIIISFTFSSSWVSFLSRGGKNTKKLGMEVTAAGE